MSRIQVAIDNTHAAIEAMNNARRDIGELSAEISGAPPQLTWASVDLGHCIRKAEAIIRELEHLKETAT